MNTLKKFISYYRPYRAVFYFDLFCAAVISVVDLAYPQLLRSLTKTLFTGNKSAILGALPWLFLILYFLICIVNFLTMLLYHIVIFLSTF